MYYRQLRAGVNDTNSKFIDSNKLPISICLENPEQDYYLSIYKFDEKQHEIFNEKNSIKGFEYALIDKLIFDFDSKNPELSRQDAITLCHKLMNEYEIPEKDLLISFSGNKGFHIEIFLTEDLNKEQFKSIVCYLASDLQTFDKKIFDIPRPFRLLGSYHEKSNLYKVRLNLIELETWNIELIKEYAKNQNSLQNLVPCDFVKLPEKLKQLTLVKEISKSEVEEIETHLDWSKKPIGYPSCRWAISNGYYKEGERHSALMALVSYLRNQGVNKVKAYHEGLGTIELQAKLNKCEEYDKEEFWYTCVNSIYDDTWKGGQYSCKSTGDPWLHSYCQSLGKHKCSNKDENCFIEIEDFANKFTEFANEIEKNRLLFGIPEIDNRLMVTTSMLVGLLGAPSAGKTTLLLNFLEESNKNTIESVFFSMDMGLPLVYLRLIQKLFGYNKQQVFEIFRDDEQKRMEIIDTIRETYKHTKFSFKTGLNMESIRNNVLQHQEKIGEKVKLVGIDYLECVKGPYSDDNANVGLVAQQCKDLANDLDTCVMLLLQTQKNSGDPSDPLLSMRNVKGASAIEQACAVILSLSRPGFSAEFPEDDKFATISLVKGRMDTLFTTDLEWNGLRGSFHTLTPENQQLLYDVRNRKKEMDKEKKDNKGGW